MEWRYPKPYWSNGTENVGNPIFDALLVFDKWDYFESCDYAFKLEETHMMQNRHATTH